MGEVNFRNISSVRPFYNKAMEYLEKGWQPMPLPSRAKNPPPTGYTGHKAKEVTGDTILQWNDNPKDKNANIGVHLTSVDFDDGEGGTDHLEVIGLDVDIEEAKNKHGDEQLDKLIEQHGPLPDTFMSTAHGPGDRAGIRFYLAPAGLAWPSHPDTSIDCIQKGHRYAVVSPSWHPTAGQYEWYFTEGGSVQAGSEPCPIPAVEDLSDLPDAWVEFLTKGFTKHSDKPMDMETGANDLVKWFNRHAHGDAPCRHIQGQLDKYVDLLEGDIHDTLRDFHYFVVASSIEGHHGGKQALKKFQREINRINRQRTKVNDDGGIDDGQGGKRLLEVRSPSDIKGEWDRSFWNAIRHIKAEVDKGTRLPQQECSCVMADFSDVYEQYGIGDKQEALDIEGFSKTDDGNAELFMQLYDGNVRYLIERDEWYYLNERNRWVLDKTNRVHAMFHAVRDSWERQVDEYRKKLANIAKDEDKYKSVMFQKKQAEQHANACGKHNASAHCLESLSHLEDRVVVSIEKADENPRLLAFPNGVVELKDDGSSEFRDHNPQDFITRCTNSDYIPWSTLRAQYEAGEGEFVQGMELMSDYFDRFIPDEEMRLFVQKIFGYSLLGENPARRAFFFLGQGSTGKSTLVNLMSKAMGSYAAPGKHDILNPPSGARNPSLFSILGCRFINMAEMGSSVEIKADALKSLASDDPQSVRDNYGNAKGEVPFEPSFTMFCPSNSVPIVVDPDGPTGNRICCVPFENRISNAEMLDGRAGEMSSLCREVVLSWAVEGWRLYVEEGLAKEPDVDEGQFFGDGTVYWPEPVREATRRFINSMSPTGEFAGDMLEFTGDPKDIIQSPRLYDAYRQYRREQGKSVDMSSRKFGEYISEQAPVAKSYREKYNGKSIKISGHSGVRFRDPTFAENNRRAIETLVQNARDRIDGKEVKVAQFKSKSAG